MKIALRCLARTGAISRSIACRASLVFEPDRLKNTPPTRFKVLPLRSRAAIELSNVGSARSPAIRSTSALCSFSPASNAGGKCSGAIVPKGGMPRWVSHLPKKGLLGGEIWAAVIVSPGSGGTAGEDKVLSAAQRDHLSRPQAGAAGENPSQPRAPTGAVPDAGSPGPALCLLPKRPGRSTALRTGQASKSYASFVSAFDRR